MVFLFAISIISGKASSVTYCEDTIQNVLHPMKIIDLPCAFYPHRRQQELHGQPCKSFPPLPPMCRLGNHPHIFGSSSRHSLFCPTIYLKTMIKIVSLFITHPFVLSNPCEAPPWLNKLACKEKILYLVWFLAVNLMSREMLSKLWCNSLYHHPQAAHICQARLQNLICT